MANKMHIAMWMTSDDKKISVFPAEKLIRVKKQTEIEFGEEFAGSNSVKEVLGDIEKDGKFEFEWQAPDKYKSLFPNLKKNKKVKFEIKISFILFDGDGKSLFSMNGEGSDATVKDAIPIGSKNAAKQKVKIECASFKAKQY